MTIIINVLSNYNVLSCKIEIVKLILKSMGEYYFIIENNSYIWLEGTGGEERGGGMERVEEEGEGGRGKGKGRRGRGDLCNLNNCIKCKVHQSNAIFGRNVSYEGGGEAGKGE